MGMTTFTLIHRDGTYFLDSNVINVAFTSLEQARAFFKPEIELEVIEADA